jgi:hypothetical protein
VGAFNLIEGSVFRCLISILDLYVFHFISPKPLLLTVIVDVVVWLAIQWNPAWSVATMYVHPLLSACSLTDYIAPIDL